MNSDEHSLCPPFAAVSATTLSQLKRLSDEELFDLLKRGCGEAMTVLFRRYHRLVLSICAKIVRDRAEAEDVMQDIFFEAFRRADRFDAAKGKLKPWLLQLAYSRAMNRRQHLLLRHFYDHPQSFPEHDPNPALHDDSDCLLGLTHEERTRILQTAMGQLPPKQRQVIELAYFQGLLIKEIAEQIGESQVNTRNHYYRGVKRIRQVVEELQAASKEAAS